MKLPPHGIIILRVYLTHWPLGYVAVYNVQTHFQDIYLKLDCDFARNISRNVLMTSGITFFALLALCAGNSAVPVNFPHKGQWRGALKFSLICAWINDWVSNREAGDLPLWSLWLQCNGARSMLSYGSPDHTKLITAIIAFLSFLSVSHTEGR